MSDKLTNCPFCGGTKVSLFLPTCHPETPYNPADRLYPCVACGTCYAGVSGKNEDYRGDSAIAAWNKRALPERTGEEGEFRAGARAMFDALLYRAANNYHPAHEARCKEENALITACAEDALADVSPDDRDEWKAIVDPSGRIAELERELAAAKRGLEEAAWTVELMFPTFKAAHSTRLSDIERIQRHQESARAALPAEPGERQ